MGNKVIYMDQKKRVLMFCVSFFGYEKRIANALREEGYEVDLYDERPSTSFVGKTCVRYNVPLYRPVIRNYILNIIRKNKDKRYDYIFVVKGEAINEDAISLLRGAYSDAEFVLYLWDSVVNIPDCEKRMKLYDRVLTFDPQDAEKYQIPLLSIPYNKEDAGLNSGAFEYDVAFVGTAHSIRPRVVKQVVRLCEEKNKSCYVYFFSPHILIYLLNKLINPDYKWISLKEVHFSALSAKQLREVYSRSRCVLDIEHPKQHGTTTRPVEMLPMKKKIITTNAFVKNYPFYNTNNFCIVDRNNIIIPDEFWELPYVEVDEEIVEKYSPAMFVKTCFPAKK